MSKRSDGKGSGGKEPGAPRSAPDRTINLGAIGRNALQQWQPVLDRMPDPPQVEGQMSMVNQVLNHHRNAENQPGQEDVIAMLLRSRRVEANHPSQPEARPEGRQEEGKQQANHFLRREEAARPQRREGAAQQSLSDRVKASLDKIADPKGPAR